MSEGLPLQPHVWVQEAGFERPRLKVRPGIGPRKRVNLTVAPHITMQFRSLAALACWASYVYLEARRLEEEGGGHG